MAPFNMLLFLLLFAACWTVLEGWSRGKTASLGAIYDVEDRVVQLRMKLKKLALNISAVKNTEQRVMAFIVNFLVRREKAASSMFLISTENNKRMYYAKRHLHLFHYETAQATCALFDGYLAEIGDASELKFITTFLAESKVLDDRAVYVGAKLVGTAWQYGRSGSPIGAFPWAAGFPQNNNKLNCACLLNRQLRQCTCPETSETEKENPGGRSFLCEVHIDP
ncbi:unnamed protein product [Lymnaea stagnalis]|uniref:C-type lectin domain-containing protein n=1 Tax=Lymnaea stagnalis TaxID=6523 RepID=A0AAV2IHY9_LYMST